MVAHSGGVLDVDEIENVHDMRVASRRLRAALEIFASCFDPEEHEQVLGEVKAIADALGERRDRDVASKPSPVTPPDSARQTMPGSNPWSAPCARNSCAPITSWPPSSPRSAFRSSPRGSASWLARRGSGCGEGPNVSGLKPGRTLAESRGADRLRAPGRDARSCFRRARARRRHSASTTCGSPPSACATCLR